MNVNIGNMADALPQKPEVSLILQVVCATEQVIRRKQREETECVPQALPAWTLFGTLLIDGRMRRRQRFAVTGSFV
jgi:hypothetical protein